MNHPNYAREWQLLEKNAHFYQTLLLEVPEPVLRRQPAPEQWSILQVMEHLLAVETATVHYLLRKNYTPLQPRGLPHALRAFLLKLALASPLKFKAPPLASLQPHNTSRPGEVLEHWHSIRQKLGSYIEALPADKEKSQLFRHPLAGGLNLHQTLQFIAEHMQHHRRQVDALLKQQNVKLGKQ
jgi:hypothetical protein